MDDTRDLAEVETPSAHVFWIRYLAARGVSLMPGLWPEDSPNVVPLAVGEARRFLAQGDADHPLPPSFRRAT